MSSPLTHCELESTISAKTPSRKSCGSCRRELPEGRWLSKVLPRDPSRGQTEHRPHVGAAAAAVAAAEASVSNLYSHQEGLAQRHKQKSSITTLKEARLPIGSTDVLT